MTDENAPQSRRLCSAQVSDELETALRKAFESILREPVPESLTNLLARIRAEEKRLRTRANEEE